MKKEVLLAIFLGAVLGGALVVLARYHQELVSLGQKQWQRWHQAPAQPTLPPTPKATSPTPAAKEKSLPLELISPADGAVVNKSPVLIKGKTQPGATVVIIGDEDEVILVADDQGNFKTNFKLTGGANDIEMTAYGPQGTEKKIVFTVTYSTAKF